MPLYQYHCHHCGNYFDEFHLMSETEKLKATVCPECQNAAVRVFTPVGIAGREFDESAFADDPPEYREMHYYEKKRDWEKAAKAAEGVSEFAKNKFLQKAKEQG